jgi:hypothetical protein
MNATPGRTKTSARRPSRPPRTSAPEGQFRPAGFTAFWADEAEMASAGAALRTPLRVVGPNPAIALEDELPREHAALIADIERARAALLPRGEAKKLRASIHDVRDLADALADVFPIVFDARLAELAEPESPLADYLRGLYVWTRAVLFAIAEWGGGRARGCARLEDAEAFYLAELEPVVDRAALRILAGNRVALPPEDRLARLPASLEVLFAQAAWLAEALRTRFVIDEA